MTDKIAVIICAAGASRRFGGNRKKPFVDVDGRAVFLRSVELFSDRKDVKQIILAISPEDQEFVQVKWGANLQFFNVKVCHGGAERFETVNNCLKLVRDDIELVAIHDAARCCVKQKWIDECFAKAEQTGAAMLASAVVGTLKRVKDGKIIETVDRSNLYEAQTPQVFSRELIFEAYEKLQELDKSTITDDSQLVEAMGKEVSIVETDSSNVKITHKSDIAIVEAIIKYRFNKSKPKGPLGPFAEAQW